MTTHTPTPTDLSASQGDVTIGPAKYDLGSMLHKIIDEANTWEQAADRFVLLLASRGFASSAPDRVPAELRELSERATPGMLAVRPQKYDDWGYLRSTTPDENDWLPVVAKAFVDWQEEEQLAARRENREPRMCAANGAFIVACWNDTRARIAAEDARDAAAQDQETAGSDAGSRDGRAEA